MAAVDVGSRSNPPVQTDDLDDIYNYEIPQDIFQDVNPDIDAPIKPAKGPLGDGKGNGGDLGLDEEVKVTRKRAPVPKLDEERLLSQAGIPKLRRTAREKLRLKGKGHEFSDVARLLNMYQLWLDDLYPRAKFADALAIIEKLGHSKRMQIMRKEWINEGKPRRYDDDFSQTKDTEQREQPIEMHTSAEQQFNDTFENAHAADVQQPHNDKNMESIEQTGSDSLFVSDDEEDVSKEDMDAPMDELDELLAQAPLKPPSPVLNVGMPVANFDDDMEAMADLGEDW